MQALEEMKKMYRIIWTHHKGSSFGYELSDAISDKKGNYVWESAFEYDTNENEVAGYVKTVINDRSVITTITNASGEIKNRTVDKVLSITFE